MWALWFIFIVFARCCNDMTAIDGIVGSILVKLTRSGSGGCSPESSGGLTLSPEAIVTVCLCIYFSTYLTTYLSVCLSACLSDCYTTIRNSKVSRTNDRNRSKVFPGNDKIRYDVRSYAKPTTVQKVLLALSSRKVACWASFSLLKESGSTNRSWKNPL